jgi:hypothetical protein
MFRMITLFSTQMKQSMIQANNQIPTMNDNTIQYANETIDDTS